VSLFKSNRDYLMANLSRLGFKTFRPAGAYFIMADHTGISIGNARNADPSVSPDKAFCRYLVETIGVAAIPPTAFYEHRERGSSLVRFSFCKKRETLEAAVQRLEKLAG
jgi:aspartate/methionine/tyrosine aminotransferase